MDVTRGSLWWVDFGDPAGSEPAYRRPALVVSADYLNRSVIDTVIVVPLTTTLRLANAPGNVLLPAGTGGLDRPSVANVTQVIVIDRARLDSYLGTMPAAMMRRVDDGLRTVMALA
jgi:mRNA interferase MazF